MSKVFINAAMNIKEQTPYQFAKKTSEVTWLSKRTIERNMKEKDGLGSNVEPSMLVDMKEIDRSRQFWLYAITWGVHTIHTIYSRKEYQTVDKVLEKLHGGWT